MPPHSEKNSLAGMVSQIADEINMQRVIDAIEEQQDDTERFRMSEKKSSHVYYVSATSDVPNEKVHIHKILERKNRSFATNIRYDKSDASPMTVICLWNHSYKDHLGYRAELNDIIEISKQDSNQFRIVIILLCPDIELPDNIPVGTLCLPGFDRVSRELIICKIVQEE
jgi:hypothetical protein